MKPKLPKYRIIMWADRSALSDHRYGIQIKPHGSKWAHCCKGSLPLLFLTPEEAKSVIKHFRKADKAAASSTDH